MSAAEQTPVQGAAVVLMTRHGATAEDAERLASVLECAGLLVHPEAAEELLQDCREQAKAEARAELDDLRDQIKEAHAREAEQQEQLAALRPPHRAPVPLVAEAYPGELDQLRERVGAVLDMCDREQRNAMRWEHPIPVPEWVAPVQRTLLGDPDLAATKAVAP